MIYAAKFLFHSVPDTRDTRDSRDSRDTRDTRDLKVLKNFSTSPNQEHFPRGGHSKLSTFENARMLLLMSGLVGPLTSEE